MLCAIAATAVGVSAAQAAVIEHEVNVPVDITLIACNGESVQMTGNAHTLIRRTDAAQTGRFSIGAHISLHLTGVGATTGGQYAFNSTINETQAFDQDFESAAEFTSVQPVTMSGAGTESNFRFKITFHVTVSATGESTASHFDFFSSCSEN